MDPVFFIDSYAQIFRGFYAVRALTNQKGEPTNAIFAMMRFLIKLETDHPAAPGAFVFDTGRPPHRLALAPDYKANRPPTPEELKAQIPTIRRMIRAFGWNIVEAENTEADDLIAALAGFFATKPIRIISADKDIAQIIDERVEMLVPDQAGKGFTKRGVAEVQEKFGVPPSAIIDYLAMIGDSADNIPGIPGVGPKTAAQLINRFGSIDNMLARACEIERESLRLKISEAGELLKKNVELVRLVTDPPAGTVWNDTTIRRQKIDFETLLEIAGEKEIRSMVRDIEKLQDTMSSNAAPDEKTSADEPPAAPEMEQMSLF